MALNLVGTSGNATIDADTGISGFTIDFDVWTTATRPASPSTGDTGFNSDLNCLETYNGSAWVSQLPSQTGNNGKYLTTNGTSPSWATVAGGPEWQAVQTGNFNATAGNAYPINTTSSAITVTLPASPTAGQQIILADYAGTWATNNVTVNPNGNKVTGQTGNGTLSTDNATCSLVYIDSTRGWIVYSNISPSYNYSIQYLLIAGGGGGGRGVAGGGGAGGYKTNTLTVSAGSSLTITVGGGGAGSTNTSSNGTSGSDSVFSSVTSTGGGGGGSRNSLNGSSGGSGGGGGYTGTGGSGTSGQGYAGGNAFSDYGGGGGGSSSVGVNGSSGVAGNGGSGTASSITGSSVTRAGGGGGGSNGGTAGTGQAGGGNGSTSSSTASNATANTGSGGGGGGYDGTHGNGGNGASGVVILSMPTAKYSGTTTGSPTVTTSGSNTILTYTSSGTYTT